MLIERSEKGQLLRGEKVMERGRDDVERFHCDDSRVNFSTSWSRPMRLDYRPRRALGRCPANECCVQATPHNDGRFLVVACSHHHSRDLISRSDFVSSLRAARLNSPGCRLSFEGQATWTTCRQTYIRLHPDRTCDSSKNKLVEPQYPPFHVMLIH